MPEGRRLGLLLRQFGPDLVTGAADDDPSGIATCSQAGAQLGCAGCWILLLCYPMMVAAQEISARIGRATGGGIVATLRTLFPRWVVYLVAALIAFANTVNLGADLGAMAEVLRLLIRGPRLAYVALFGALCAGLLIRLRLRLYMRFVAWAALSLSVYVLTAIDATSSRAALLRLPAPSVFLDQSSIATLVVAVLGTTLSPYLFIWHRRWRASGLTACQACGSRMPPSRPVKRRGGSGRTPNAGMAVAMIVAYAVVVTAASTLHASGITAIETTAQAAEQLRQLAGPLTHVLFSLGILATGLLAVPMLAGSAAFAVGEALGWPVGLARMPGEVPAFHGCILAVTAAGVVMNMFGANAMRALLWSAVINSVLAAPVLVAMMLVATRREMMGWLALSPLLAALGWLTTAAMGAATLGVLVTLRP